MSKMFMNVKRGHGSPGNIGVLCIYKLMKRLKQGIAGMECQTIAGKVDGSIFMSSSMEQDRMMGGIRNGNLQE